MSSFSLRDAWLEAAFLAHADEVRALCCSVVGDANADDLVSETFIVAMRRFETVAPERAKPWLFGIARNLCLQHARADGRRRRRDGRQVLARAAEAAPQIEDGVVTRMVVSDALSRVRESDRLLLLEWAWLDPPPTLAAERLGWTRANYSVRVHRALKRLRNEIDATEGEASHG